MAFAPVSWSQIGGATSELLPHMARTLQAPFRLARKSAPTNRSRNQSAPVYKAAPQEKVIADEHAETLSMPAYMSSVPLSALRTNAPSRSALRYDFSPASILSSTPQGMLRYASPLTRPFSSFPSTSRSVSTATRLGPFTFRAPPQFSLVGYNQQRTLFGSSWRSNSDRNMLAQLERSANNSPQSASAQNTFYQALLRANMPEIVLERYSTQQYATNAHTDQLHQFALSSVIPSMGGSKGMISRVPGGQGNNQPTSDQTQAVAQALAAKASGSNASISKDGTGSKVEPLYVVVDETLSSIIFRWVKFLLTWGLTLYCLLVVLTLLIDATGTLRKVGGVHDAESKPELQKTKFADVHGCDEAKEELQELVEFLKNPQQFSTLGGKLPKGILLVGPPGTGKTLLARAVAGEAGVPFFYMSGSEFDEVYVGVGAKRIRDLFTNARAKSPAIIFIDELDAIGGRRNERDHAHARQTLNQLLTELDGFDQDSGVILLGATNFPQSLDKALTRPGRFDRNVVVSLPDVRGRIAILKYYLRNVSIDAAVDPAIVARGCPGFSGAELENLVNQAAVRASKNKQPKVTIEDLVWAKDKIMMGAERRSAVITPKDKLATAYHEAGHALVCMLTQDATPLYKATIMPRGQSLGITFMLPEMDKVSETKRELEARIDVSMGGKMAEELIYGPENVTTGASSDISNATAVAHMMVTRAGMSEVLGNVDLSDMDTVSPETRQRIDNEVRRIVEEGRQRAYKLLTTNRASLERLARALVEYETLSKDEMEKIVKGEKLVGKLKADFNVPIKEPEAKPTSILPGPLGIPPSNPGSSGSSSGGNGGQAIPGGP